MAFLGKYIIIFFQNFIQRKRNLGSRLEVVYVSAPFQRRRYEGCSQRRFFLKVFLDNFYPYE